MHHTHKQVKTSCSSWACLIVYLRGEGAFPVVFTAENSIRPNEEPKSFISTILAGF